MIKQHKRTPTDMAWRVTNEVRCKVYFITALIIGGAAGAVIHSLIDTT